MRKQKSKLRFEAQSKKREDIVSPLFAKLLFSLIGAVFILSLFSVFVSAAASYTVAPGVTNAYIYEYSLGKCVSNSGSNPTIFIGTATSGEWSSAIASPPSGVTYAAPAHNSAPGLFLPGLCSGTNLNYANNCGVDSGTLDSNCYYYCVGNTIYVNGACSSGTCTNSGGSPAVGCPSPGDYGSCNGLSWTRTYQEGCQNGVGSCQSYTDAGPYDCSGSDGECTDNCVSSSNFGCDNNGCHSDQNCDNNCGSDCGC